MFVVQTQVVYIYICCLIQYYVELLCTLINCTKKIKLAPEKRWTRYLYLNVSQFSLIDAYSRYKMYSICVFIG
jgi:hypothetical protein